MNASLQSLSRQLAGNPRLKVGIALIVALVAGFALMGVHDWRVQQQNKAIEAEVELRETRSLRGQDIWLQRAEQMQASRKALLAEVPVVATTGIAQATLQSWLRNVAGSVRGNEDIRIEVSPPVELEDHPGIYRARATINASMTPRQALDFMATVESTPNLAVVETVTLHGGTTNRATMTVVAYYRTGEGAPDAAEATP